MTNKVYGYARVSTDKQRLDRQLTNITNAYPSAIMVTDTYTGTQIDRPAFTKLLRALRAGDTVVFDSVSRMSRNASEGLELYEKLYADGVNLVFLKEHHIDTDTYRQAQKDSVTMTGDEVVDAILDGVNKALRILRKRQIEQAFEQSQKEVDDLHKRVSEGMRATQRRNEEYIIMGETDKVKQIGQKVGAHWETKKAKECKALILKHSKDFNGTLNDIECMKLCGLARNSFYKYKRELRF